ncbi:MAG: hypothetical protein ABI626_07975 [Sphingomicrobium sp.]
MFTLGRAEAPPQAVAASSAPPIAATEFPALEPGPDQAVPSPVQVAAPAATQTAQLPAPTPAPGPIYFYPVGPPSGVPYAHATLPDPRPGRLPPIQAEPAAVFYAPIPQLDEWPLVQMASTAMPVQRSSTATSRQSFPQATVQARLDRLQLSAWALLRGVPGPSSLATGGTLGGSQAGTRLTYVFAPGIAASLRGSSPVGGTRGGEVAGGVRLTSFRSIPVSLTVERRQAIGAYGGRSAFAMFLEGGVYQRPMPLGLDLDGYVQGGVVGARQRDLFIDGGATLTRPLFGRFWAGFGLWGGAQPGLYRLDVGPRVSLRVRNNMRVHLDYRYRLVGNAEPGSGPTVTLAADF